MLGDDFGEKRRAKEQLARSDNNSVREKLVRYIREQGLLCAGDRVLAAVSGGADSVALLRVLLELRAELGIVLALAHFNHGLRAGQSTADEAFAAELAKKHGLDFFVGHGNVRDHAFTSKLSIEAAGRELRYGWLGSVAMEQRFDRIATAHTFDDQAETVLLKFLRGAGTKGLAGIYPRLRLSSPDDSNERQNPRGPKPTRNDRIEFEERRRGAAEAASLLSHAPAHPPARIVRPLLSVSRAEVESYLTSLSQEWREDESNLDRRFLRNRVRHELLPLLEREYNPNIRQALSDLAEVSRGEEEFWQERVKEELRARLISRAEDPAVEKPILRGLKPAHDDNSVSEAEKLNIKGLAQLPIALQRRLLKGFAEDNDLALDFEHIEILRHCALGECSRAELPGGRIVSREGAMLALRTPGHKPASAYTYVLSVPGETSIAELGLKLRAELVTAEFAEELPSGELLSFDLIGSELAVRNWCPGDRFWPAHSRSEEKLKRLFAEKHIPAEQRLTWPVALHADQIVWVRGFPVAQAYRWKGNGDAIRIEMIPPTALRE